MKTAFCYHRYSTDMQREGYSLEVQRNLTKKLSEKHQCTISAVYEDEGISGATIEKRPQMLALLEDIKNVSPDYVICVDQDRISRGNEFWYIKSLMSKYNVSLITEKEGIINFKEDISMDFMSDIIASAAKYERGMIKQRIKRAMAQRASKGYFVGNILNINGYDYINGNLVINQTEAALIKRIYKMSLNGQGYLRIARQLNLEGYLTKNKHPFSLELVRYILLTPFYCGYIRHGGDIIKGKHEPIIDEKIYKKVQENIAVYRRINITRPAKYLLTGFLKCANCGYNLGGQIKQTNPLRVIYKCNGYQRGLCNNPVFLSKDKIEGYVIQKIKDKILSLQLNFVPIVVKKDLPLDNLDIGKKRVQLQKKLDKLIIEYTEGYLDKGRYRQHVHNINLQIAELKTKAPESLDTTILKDIDPTIVFDSADYNDKRRIIALMVDKIIVSRTDGSHNVSSRVKIFWNVLK